MKAAVFTDCINNIFCSKISACETNNNKHGKEREKLGEKRKERD